MKPTTEAVLALKNSNQDRNEAERECILQGKLKILYFDSGFTLWGCPLITSTILG